MPPLGPNWFDDEVIDAVEVVVEVDDDVGLSLLLQPLPLSTLLLVPLPLLLDSLREEEDPTAVAEEEAMF